MSTTSTIYASKDTWLDGDNTGANNSGDAFITLGQQTIGFSTEGERANGIFAFDVSALTPSLLTQVNFKLNYKGAGKGAGARQCYVYRLARDFVENQATWLVSATGTDWTAADGGASDSATTEPYATFDVGFRTDDDVSVDITELVVDAINRRSGTLYLWVGIPLSDTATSRASGQYHSLEATSAGDRPRLECITADRIVWDGSAGDGNANTDSNWVGDTAPTVLDIAIFNTGNVSVTSGYILGDKVFVGRNYKGDIGTSASTILVMTNKLACSSRYSKMYIQTGAVGNVVRVGNTSSESQSFYITGNSALVIVQKARTTVEIDGANTNTVDVHSGARVKLSDRYTVRSTRSYITLDGGVAAGTFADRSSLYFNQSSATVGDLVIAGGTSATIYTDEIDELTIYSGRASFRGNTGSPIEVGDTLVYPNGVLDARTGASTFTNDSGDDITVYGGAVLFDASTKVSIA